MTKEKLERTKPHASVGTIGHVDHGRALLSSVPQFHSRTTDVTGSILLPRGAEMVMAGAVIQ